MIDINIRETSGVYALDMNYQTQTITLYFNSRQNAVNVKRIIEIDRLKKAETKTAVEALQEVAEAYV